MKTSCGYKQLIDAITVAERMVGKKESLPVLSCILLEARKNSCVIKATNLEAGVEITLPAKTEEEGVVAVPAHILSQTIRASQSDHVTIETEDLTCVIKTPKGIQTLKTIAVDEFPSLPKTEEKHPITIKKQLLIEGITSVSYAAAHSVIRPEFASIFIQHTGNFLVCAATDSFRLAEKKIQASFKEDFPEILIPTKHALEAVHVLEHSPGEDVSIVVDDGQITIATENTQFISRVTDATFPNYTAIIPKQTITTVTALKEDVASLLRKAKLFSHTTQQCSFHLYPKKKIATVTAQHKDIGEMSESMDAVLEGEDLDINFNVSYVADCMSTIRSDSVVMKFAGAGKPLIIQGVGDNTFTYLVMPLNR